MNKYAKASLFAIKNYNQSDVKDIVKSWQLGMLEIFPTQESSRKKGCPKSAFLGLCENGYISGIPQGKYLLRKTRKNKDYSIQAIKLLKENPHLVNIAPSKLWKLVMNGDSKPHNSQMDIVLALWSGNLIN